MADSYISVTNTDALMVPVKAATIYAAHESSLFLSGQLIPSVAAPNGLLQVPELADVSATTITSGITTDVAVTNPADTKNIITCDLFAARSVVRDLGAIDPAEIGRVLGNAVSKAFDKRVMSVMGTLTGQEITDSAGLTIAEIANAVGTIRGTGETGPLYGIVGAGSYSQLMQEIGSQAYAGGDLFQGQALRSGFFGTIMGVQMFVSSYLDATNTAVAGAKAAIFSADAMRIAMQKNVDLEIARRAEAVGFDVVASLHANVGLIDANRGILLKDAV